MTCCVERIRLQVQHLVHPLHPATVSQQYQKSAKRSIRHDVCVERVRLQVQHLVHPLHPRNSITTVPEEYKRSIRHDVLRGTHTAAGSAPRTSSAPPQQYHNSTRRV